MGLSVEGLRERYVLMNNERMEALHLYIDEAGNFDFGANGTAWIILTCVHVPWDCQRIARLAQLKHDLLHEGLGLEYFHASEDNQRVRQRFLEAIRGILPQGAVKARIVLKSAVAEGLRHPEKFYPAFVGPLVERHTQQHSGNVYIFSDALPVNKKRRGLEKAVANKLSAGAKEGMSYTFLHHASKSNFDLQIADYCCWAIWRALTKGDRTALEVLGDSVEMLG
jgi:hypothetical protein